MSILDLLWLSKHRLRLYCQIFQNVSIMVTHNVLLCRHWLRDKLTISTVKNFKVYISKFNIFLLEINGQHYYTELCFYCWWIFLTSINWWCCDILSPPRMCHTSYKSHLDNEQQMLTYSLIHSENLWKLKYYYYKFYHVQSKNWLKHQDFPSVSSSYFLNEINNLSLFTFP